ncbi:MAG: hypothetical protein IE933_09010 [Sphingomonadales bacterium]|nr:hypothetical protein [Sphingomonadales bacterium]MBD3773648.1 hypothetical protein [Paracoccaceae bacterium]
MAIFIITLLGIGNFALNRAVLESQHPLFGREAWLPGGLGVRISFASEFLLLLAALWFAANGSPELGWAYFAYSLFNATAAWLILTRRV